MSPLRNLAGNRGRLTCSPILSVSTIVRTRCVFASKPAYGAASDSELRCYGKTGTPPYFRLLVVVCTIENQQKWGGVPVFQSEKPMPKASGSRERSAFYFLLGDVSCLDSVSQLCKCLLGATLFPGLPWCQADEPVAHGPGRSRPRPRDGVLARRSVPGAHRAWDLFSPGIAFF